AISELEELPALRSAIRAVVGYSRVTNSRSRWRGHPEFGGGKIQPALRLLSQARSTRFRFLLQILAPECWGCGARLMHRRTGTPARCWHKVAYRWRGVYRLRLAGLNCVALGLWDSEWPQRAVPHQQENLLTRYAELRFPAMPPVRSCAACQRLSG